MPTHLPILVAEDEESDVVLLRMALEKAGVPNPLITARDGQETIEYLSGEGQFSDRTTNPLPGLLILDLKMPRMTGFDVLCWLAANPAFKELPVVVLSSSSYEEDMTKARQLGAREYYVKPHSLKQLVEILRQLAERWLARA
jgi:CheY-like chemotaxis protein